MNWIPLNNYHITQTKKISKISVGIVLFVFVSGNIITAIVNNRVKVDIKSYYLKDGFPMFVSGKEYIRLLKSYNYSLGTNIKFHTIGKDESFWDIARVNNISVNTIIAANPFIKNLDAENGVEIVVPLEDGVLLPVDNAIDVWSMSRKLDGYSEIKGDFLPGIFGLIALIRDDIRFAFFTNARPVLVNEHIQNLFTAKRMFQSPIMGLSLFTSYFGDRHKFGRFTKEEEGMEFHNGVDIMAKIGTPIYPLREGIVSHVGWIDGYGLAITILHPDGYVSMYGHCSAIKVNKGDKVNKKTLIGLVGSTGRSTGPHLHFIVQRHGRYINPLYYIW